MRTTIRLDDELLAAAKAQAAREGRTLTAVIGDALRERLARSSPTASQAPVSLPTFAGDGVQPGIDLDDSAALLDQMESGNGPA